MLCCTVQYCATVVLCCTIYIILYLYYKYKCSEFFFTLLPKKQTEKKPIKKPKFQKKPKIKILNFKKNQLKNQKKPKKPKTKIKIVT